MQHAIYTTHICTARNIYHTHICVCMQFISCLWTCTHVDLNTRHAKVQEWKCQVHWLSFRHTRVLLAWDISAYACTCKHAIYSGNLEYSKIVPPEHIQSQSQGCHFLDCSIISHLQVLLPVLSWPSIFTIWHEDQYRGKVSASTGGLTAAENLPIPWLKIRKHHCDQQFTFAWVISNKFLWILTFISCIWQILFERIWSIETALTTDMTWKYISTSAAHFNPASNDVPSPV